jgi:hypothetical protein
MRVVTVKPKVKLTVMGLPIPSCGCALNLRDFLTWKPLITYLCIKIYYSFYIFQYYPTFPISSPHRIIVAHSELSELHPISVHPRYRIPLVARFHSAVKTLLGTPHYLSSLSLLIISPHYLPSLSLPIISPHYLPSLSPLMRKLICLTK